MDRGIIAGMRAISGVFVACAALLGLAVSSAHAQRPGGDGVASSGMGQGNPAITTRSDVRLSVESEGNTNRARLTLIGNAVGTKMTAIRECYADVVAARPTVTGQLKIKVELVSGQRDARVTVFQDRANDDALTRCIVRAIRQASMRDISAPATAVIVLDLDNSAARGVAITQRRAEAQRASVEVSRTSDGHFEAHGATLGNEVRFTLTSRGNETEDAVGAAQRGLKTGIAPLRDCRRRAGRLDQSPEGEIVVDLQVPARGARRATVVSSTVHEERAGQCVARALTRAPMTRDAAGRYRVSVHFTPTEPTGATPPPAPAPPPRGR